MAENDNHLTPPDDANNALVPQPPALPAGRRPGVNFGAIVARGPLVAYILVVLAVLVTINVLASGHDKSWDLTKTHQFSLSPESIQILKGLKQPLHLIDFDKNAQFGAAKDFLGRYQRESNKVDVQYVNPDTHPDQAKQYGIQTYGTIVVQSGDRKELVTTMAEQDVTNAIVRTLKGERKVVYFTQGEGEHDPDDTGRSGLSSLKQELETENFTVQKLVLAQNPAVPADCAVLVVDGPTHALVAPEVQAIETYINGGGRALFMIGVDTTGPLVDYLQNTLNVKLTPDVVIDTSGVGQLFGASELMPIVAHYDQHPITAEMNGTATLFPYARTVAANAAPGAKAIVTPIAETSSASIAASNFAGGRVQPSATDPHGPFSLAVVGSLPTTIAAGPHTGDSAEARYVVIGSPDMVVNSIITFNGNRDFVMNSFNWLSTQESFITIRPQPPTNAPVNLSAAQMRMVFWIFIIALPLFIIIMGVSMWWRRRAL